MTNRYAPGRRAWGECGRSGRRMLLKDMVFDGRYPNMRVDPAWYEGKHPQETLPKVEDAIALYRPAPQALPPPTTPVLAGALEGGAVELSWSEATSHIALVNAYAIYRAIGESEAFDLLTTLPIARDPFAAIETELVYTDEDVQAGNTYRYYIVARAVKGGDSAPSNIISIDVE